jgi:hypothetical protein
VPGVGDIYEPLCSPESDIEHPTDHHLRHILDPHFALPGVIMENYPSFVKKFSKFLLAQQSIPVFQVNDSKLVGDNFFLWMIKYFEELTKLLSLNEKHNIVELQRVLDYVYSYLTVELFIFAYLSEQEMQSESQQTLQITFELIQEPFKRF